MSVFRPPEVIATAAVWLRASDSMKRRMLAGTLPRIAAAFPESREFVMTTMARDLRAKQSIHDVVWEYRRNVYRVFDARYEQQESSYPAELVAIGVDQTLWDAATPEQQKDFLIRYIAALLEAYPRQAKFIQGVILVDLTFDFDRDVRMLVSDLRYNFLTLEKLDFESRSCR